jgi:membrane protein required for colicin V production
MNALDWLILTLLMFSALLAAAQGFFFEIISLSGAVGGFLLAAWGCGKMAPWFLPYVKSQAVAQLTAFLAIYFGVVVLAGALARIVRWMVHESGFRWADRLLGAAFGFVRGAVIVTAGLLALTAFVPESHQLAGSSLASHFLLAGRGASWLAPAEIREKFRAGMNLLRGPAPGAEKRSSTEKNSGAATGK